MASKGRVAVLEMHARGVRVTPAERNVLHGMTEYMTGPEGFCWYAKETIASYAGMNARNARVHLKNLEWRGIVRRWLWTNPSGRQGANLYKIELQGLAPVTERTIQWIKSQRGGCPAVGWDQFRIDLGVLPYPDKTRGVDIDTPQSGARDVGTDTPEGCRFEHSRGVGIDIPYNE